MGAPVVFTASAGVTKKQVLSKLGKGPIKVSERSSLVLDGPDIHVESLELDGALVIHAVPGAKVHIKNLSVKNKGWDFKEIDVNDKKIPQKYLIRGYVMNKEETATIAYEKPGDYVVSKL